MRVRKCDTGSTDPKYWQHVVSNFNMEEQKEFKKRLLQALACNTNEPRLDETTIQYLQRKGQRRSEVARHGIAGWKAQVSTVET